MNNHWRKRIIEASCLDKKEDDDNINMNNNNKKKLDENRISPVKNTNKDVSNKPNGEKNGTVSSNFTQNSTIIAVSSNQNTTNSTTPVISTNDTTITNGITTSGSPGCSVVSSSRSG